MKTVLKKCWTMLARGVCWCCGSLHHPGFHVGELWPRFTPLKMSVWLQMKHSNVKWNERSWSNCSWVKPVIMPPVSASFASALQVHHWRAFAFNQEFSRKKGSAEAAEAQSPKVAPESKRKRTPIVKSQFPLSGRNENVCCYQGGFLYSGVSIATVSMCPFYKPAELLLCNMWKKQTNVRYNMIVSDQTGFI